VLSALCQTYIWPTANVSIKPLQAHPVMCQLWVVVLATWDWHSTARQNSKAPFFHAGCRGVCVRRAERQTVAILSSSKRATSACIRRPPQSAAGRLCAFVRRAHAGCAHMLCVHVTPRSFRNCFLVQ